MTKVKTPDSPVHRAGTKKSAARSATVTKRPIERMRSRKKVNEIVELLDVQRNEDGSIKLPRAEGGVRFDGKRIKGIYVPQRDFVDMGRPEQLEHVLRVPKS